MPHVVATVRWIGDSMLRSDLGGKGLGYYFLVPHKEGVSSAFVCVVLGLCIPQDVGIVTFNGPLLHRKRCTRADGPSLPIVVFSSDSEKLGSILAGLRRWDSRMSGTPFWILLL